MERRRPVWFDPAGVATTATCPVLAFTPEVASALRWFDATHELVVDGGWQRWRRTSFPAPGGAGEQDTRLIGALDTLRRVHDDLVTVRKKHTDG